jgi:hypothetical protein
MGRDKQQGLSMEEKDSSGRRRWREEITERVDEEMLVIM